MADPTADDSITALAKQRLKDSLMGTPGMQQPNLSPQKTPYQPYGPPSVYQPMQPPPNPEDPITARQNQLNTLMTNPSQDPRYRASEDTTLQQGAAAKQRAAETLRGAGDPVAVARELEKYDFQTQQTLANRAADLYNQSNQELGSLATQQAQLRGQQQQQFNQLGFAGQQLGEQSRQFGANLGLQTQAQENQVNQFGQTLANRQNEFGQTLNQQQAQFAATNQLQQNQLAEQQRQFNLSLEQAKATNSPVHTITNSVASGLGQSLGKGVGSDLASGLGGFLGNVFSSVGDFMEF